MNEYSAGKNSPFPRVQENERQKHPLCFVQHQLGISKDTHWPDNTN